MSDRGALFLFSLTMMFLALSVAGWLIAGGRAGEMDGLFLVCVSLLTALAFGLYLRYLLHTAMAPRPEPQPRKTAEKPLAAEAQRPAATSK